MPFKVYTKVKITKIFIANNDTSLNKTSLQMVKPTFGHSLCGFEPRIGDTYGGKKMKLFLNYSLPKFLKNFCLICFESESIGEHSELFT